MDSLLHALQYSVMYVAEAFARIFTPSDDSYPVMGVTPFDGTPYKSSPWED